MEKVTSITNIKTYNLTNSINKNITSNNQIRTNNNVDLKGFAAYQQYFIPFKGLYTSSPVIDLSTIESYNLANNIRLDFETKFSNTETNARILLTPNKEIEAKPGTYDLLNYILAEEPEKQSRTSDDNSDNELPLHLVCEVYDKKIEGYMYCDHTRTLEGLEKLKHFVFNPNFTEESLANAKNKLKKDFKYASENIGYKVEEELLNGSYDEKIKNVDSITLDDVKNLYNQLIANSEGKVVVSLPKPVYKQQKNDIFNILSTGIPTLKPYTGNNYSKETTPIEKDIVYKQTTKADGSYDINKTSYYKMFALPSLKSAKEEAIADMLGSAIELLFTEQTGTHVAFGHLNGLLTIHTYHKTYNGVFDNIENKPKNTVEYEKMLNEVIKRIIETPISESEFLKARWDLEENYSSIRLEQYARTFELVNNRPGGNNYINEYDAELAKVTPADIQAAAKKYLTQHSITVIEEKI